MHNSLRHMVVGSLILVMILAGCLSPEERSVTQTEHDSTTQTDVTVGLPTFLSHGLLRRAVLDEIIRDYEAQYPHVVIKVKEENDNSYEGLDILISIHHAAEMLFEKGRLQDLSSVQPNWDPRIAHVTSHAHHEGQTIFLPIMVLPWQLAAIPEAFTAANVAMPHPEWSYADLEVTLRELKEAGYQPVFSKQDLLRAVLRAYGVDLYDPVTGRWYLDTPEVRQAAAFVTRLSQDGLLGDSEGARVTTFGANLTPLTNWFDELVPDEMTPIPYPQGPVGRGQAISSVGVMVFAESTTRDETLHFARFLVEEGGPKTLARHGWRPLVYSESALDIWRATVDVAQAELMEELLVSGRPVDYNGDIGHVTWRLSEVKDEHELDQVIAELDQEFNP